jgi:hypothetical protein
MKKVLLSVLSVITFGAAALAQDEVEIYLVGGTTDYSSGLAVYQQTVNSAYEITSDFEVKNVSGSQKTWRITRLRIDEIPTWSDYLCWDLCFDAGAMATNPWTSTTTRTIEDDANSVLNTYITPDEFSPGTVTYRYYVSEDGVNYVDSLDVEISFTLNVASITPEVSISVSPNPASDYVVIKANGSEGGTIRIVDVLGNVVLTESLSENKKINVANFRNGIYFVIVQPENGKAVNKKIVVKH